MAQHDYSIANQGFPAFRADLNDALAGLVSNSSGATEPSTIYAHQFWVDTSADPSVLKQRNADNDAWITIASIDQTGDTFNLAVAQGGTGAATAAAAKIALEVITATTGSAVVPAGTEAQRDGSPAAGYFRFNSDTGAFEGYNGTAWGAVGGGATAKAWVNFNGIGTVAIRRAFNVSSITDNGTGNYTVNFTTAMPDANYAVTGTGSGSTTTLISIVSVTAIPRTTSSYTFVTTYQNGVAAVDIQEANVAIFS